MSDLAFFSQAPSSQLRIPLKKAQLYKFLLMALASFNKARLPAPDPYKLFYRLAINFLPALAPSKKTRLPAPDPYKLVYWLAIKFLPALAPSKKAWLPAPYPYKLVYRLAIIFLPALAPSKKTRLYIKNVIKCCTNVNVT